MNILNAQNIMNNYNTIQVLHGANISIEQGEVVALLGASGAGKSTFLHICGTLEKMDSGTLEIAGKQIHTMKSQELSRFRNQEIGFIFQAHHLLPEFTALENVSIPAWIGKKSEAQLLAKKILDQVGLEHRVNHKPSELSGGEQQRVAIARALVNNPKIIFADEPTGNLDSANAQIIMDLLLQLQKELQLTIFLVTHSSEVAERCTRQVLMRDGRVE
jgi:lipoprotein-releasing system ATP-binding protein